eukprot:171834-Alexandrium_andersonii.AAC.1
MQTVSLGRHRRRRHGTGHRCITADSWRAIHAYSNGIGQHFVGSELHSERRKQYTPELLVPVHHDRRRLSLHSVLLGWIFAPASGASGP